jgi:hypothetical protein
MKNNSLYNMQLIWQMTRGNTEKARKFIRLFVEKTPLTLKEHAAAYYSLDFPRLRELSHKIRPTFSYYGINSVVTLLHQIEFLAEKEELNAELESKLEQVKNITAAVIEEMVEEYLATGKHLQNVETTV